MDPATAILLAIIVVIIFMFMMRAKDAPPPAQPVPVAVIDPRLDDHMGQIITSYIDDPWVPAYDYGYQHVSPRFRWDRNLRYGRGPRGMGHGPRGGHHGH